MRSDRSQTPVPQTTLHNYFKRRQEDTAKISKSASKASTPAQKQQLLQHYRKNLQYDDFSEEFKLRQSQSNSENLKGDEAIAIAPLRAKKIRKDEQKLPLNDLELIATLEQEVLQRQALITESDTQNGKEQPEKRSYSLLEDLYLIVGMVRTKEKLERNFTGYGDGFFQELRRNKFARLSRSEQSLRNRYDSYLRGLTREALLEILDQIRSKNNLDEYILHFKVSPDDGQRAYNGLSKVNSTQLSTAALKNKYASLENLDVNNKENFGERDERPAKSFLASVEDERSIPEFKARKESEEEEEEEEEKSRCQEAVIADTPQITVSVNNISKTDEDDKKTTLKRTRSFDDQESEKLFSGATKRQQVAEENLQQNQEINNTQTSAAVEQEFQEIETKICLKLPLIDEQPFDLAIAQNLQVEFNVDDNGRHIRQVRNIPNTLAQQEKIQEHLIAIAKKSGFDLSSLDSFARLQEIFEQTSNNLQDFEQYLRNRDKDDIRQRVLWQPLDDSALESAKDRNDTVFRLLCNYKGAERVQRRLIFKNKTID